MLTPSEQHDVILVQTRRCSVQLPKALLIKYRALNKYWFINKPAFKFIPSDPLNPNDLRVVAQRRQTGGRNIGCSLGADEMDVHHREHPDTWACSMPDF